MKHQITTFSRERHPALWWGVVLLSFASPLVEHTLNVYFAQNNNNNYLVLNEMNLGKQSLVFALVLSTAACSSFNYSSDTSLTVRSTQQLPAVLSESSGLLCEADGIVSLNDSGNNPELFWVNYDGAVSNTVSIPVTNKDWEALAADNRYMYVADVGNNHGKRDSVQIYKVLKSDPQQVSTIEVSYRGNNPTRNTSYAHDYDAEAMVVAKDRLLLFSKSWKTKVAHVYEVNTQQKSQTLVPISHIEGLPGVITGADFDSTEDRFVVVGYLSDPFGNFDTFMAHVSSTFEVIEVWPLEGFKQVEGVCISPSGNYYFSQEAIDEQPATLTEANVTLVGV